jgi:hypothetical protein
MKPFRLVLAAALLCFAGCTAVEQADFNTWLNSPSTQSVIGNIENFAVSFLEAYLTSHVTAGNPVTGPDYSKAEPGAIAAVRKQFHLNQVQATWVVRQAEARLIAESKVP